MSRRRSGFAALLLLGLALAVPSGVLANTNEPIAQTGGMEATLPLLGSSLTVGVTLDDVGKITGVSLNPTGVVSQTESTDSAVTFADSAGTTKVVVRARGSKETIAAKVPKLADITGTGAWKADVFGTGTSSTVDYTIGADGNGNPTVAIGTISAAAGITATKEDPVAKTGGKGHLKSWAAGIVTFTRDGFTKRLTITVAVKDDGAAYLKISLKGKDRQRVEGTLEQLAGARTWSAHLCDGTAVSVKFHVTAEGTVAFDGATGATATNKTGKNGGLWVRFDDTWVGMMAFVRKQDDTTYRLTVKGLSGFCGDKGWWHRDKDKDKDQGQGQGATGRGTGNGTTVRWGAGDRDRDQSGRGGDRSGRGGDASFASFRRGDGH